YFETIKDVLYCDDLHSKRRKQVIITLYYILQLLLKVISPIIPFLAEEIYQSVNFDFSCFFDKESIHLVEYPSNPEFILKKSIKKIENDFEKNVIPLRKEVFRFLEKSRQEKIIDVNSQAVVTINIDDKEKFNY